jgi:hypothetical protein
MEDGGSKKLFARLGPAVCMGLAQGSKGYAGGSAAGSLAYAGASAWIFPRISPTPATLPFRLRDAHIAAASS